MDKDFGKILRDLRKSRGYSQQELGEALSFTRQTISNYEKGRRTPHKEILEEIADFFSVDMDFLYGKTSIENRYREMGKSHAHVEHINFSKSILIPIVGSIPVGVPIEDIEDIVGSVLIPEEWTKLGDEFFALRVSGDSMHPLFFDGDTAIIKRQAHANTGDVCVCYSSGHDYATIKRIKLSEHAITLQPENSNYSPVTYTHPGEVSIAGKVVEMRRKI